MRVIMRLEKECYSIMSVFNRLIKPGNEGELKFNEWIKWKHFLIPDRTGKFREFMRSVLETFGHCEICTSLSGCYFFADNKPTYELHKNCDCAINGVSIAKVIKTARTECDISKFTKYIFQDDKKSRGKNKIFYEWGYDIDDSESLCSTYRSQVLEGYLSGNYILKGLDQYGQRVAIPIRLKGKIFYVGCIIYPLGYIKVTTPFAGWYE